MVSFSLVGAAVLQPADRAEHDAVVVSAGWRGGPAAEQLEERREARGAGAGWTAAMLEGPTVTYTMISC